MTEHPGCTVKKLITALHDLVGMKNEILRQLDQVFLILDRGHRHFRLECRAVIPA